ncbi:PqqD family protein [Domibacillus sp. PGB-M46]|uniref:PqqD family protein n=1 Tax=Domibacillus sp. PGB-M46 TaxID=2910255 RepID=UPI001F567BB1|nr:PqqD family protein [Domibacillus sp. PGB-M46]MCI2255180.1 PqqD family protein [Domibacillus sp. PGB-M46]
MTTYVRKSEADAVELDGEWIILNMEQYTVTTINEVGGFCWELLRDKQTPESIAQAVMKEYDTQGRAVEADIEEFLAHLSRCELVDYERE